MSEHDPRPATTPESKFTTPLTGERQALHSKDSRPNPLGKYKRTPGADMIEAVQKEQLRRGTPREAMPAQFQAPTEVPVVEASVFEIQSQHPDCTIEGVHLFAANMVLFNVFKEGEGVSNKIVPVPPKFMKLGEARRLEAESHELPTSKEGVSVELILIRALDGALVITAQEDMGLSVDWTTIPAAQLRRSQAKPRR